MKNLLLIIFLTFTLVRIVYAGSHSVLAGSSPETIVMDEGFFLPQGCVAGNFFVTNPSVMVPGDGSPMPVCQPGKPGCNNDQFQLRAGDGGRQPVCAPGENCNNDDFQLRAGDGSPPPVSTSDLSCLFMAPRELDFRKTRPEDESGKELVLL